MRQNFDFFDLTGLPFDPPVQLQEQVAAAISNAVSVLSAQLGCQTQQLQRDLLREQLYFLKQQSDAIETEGWAEASKRFKTMADQKRERELAQVRSAASLLAQNDIKSLNKAVVRSFRQKTGLSE